MSIFGLPLILFKVGVKGRKLSDIEFLAIKEFDNKLRQDDGTLGAGSTGDLATLTADTGKDMYLAEAQITYTISGVISGAASTVVLKINGVIEETVRPYGSMGSTASGGTIRGGNGGNVIKFNLKSRKVLAGEIIKIEVTGTSPEIAHTGELTCWEETTNDSPQIPSI